LKKEISSEGGEKKNEEGQRERILSFAKGRGGGEKRGRKKS